MKHFFWDILPLSRVARRLSAWRTGHGDYVQTRDTLFVRETVDTLFDKAKAAHPR